MHGLLPRTFYPHHHITFTPNPPTSAAQHYLPAPLPSLPSISSQFVHGYGATGAALVSSGVEKVVFVGSPAVGKLVMRSAAATLTPVVLELGGKDPFVVCDDVTSDSEMGRIIQIACRGVFQNMGQNCAGPERFFVQEGVYDDFCRRIAVVVAQLRTGPPLGSGSVDCGATTMGLSSMERLQGLVDDAVAHGARVLAGGDMHLLDAEEGTFYPPTVLCDVPEDARIAQEEIFGPIMCIFKVKGAGAQADDNTVRMANNCDFGLSSCAFAQDGKRARAVAGRLKAGMSSVNDLEGTTYMSQSLPFGGVGESGFDCFAGPEGLRGMTQTRSICEDKVRDGEGWGGMWEVGLGNQVVLPVLWSAVLPAVVPVVKRVCVVGRVMVVGMCVIRHHRVQPVYALSPTDQNGCRHVTPSPPLSLSRPLLLPTHLQFDLMRTAIPPALQYPSKGKGPGFAMALIQMFYGHSFGTMFRGLVKLLGVLVGKGNVGAAKKAE